MPKEIAQLDGAFVITADGIIERSRQMLEVLHEDLNMSKGLGSRHWAAAAITRRTKAIACCGQSIDGHRSAVSERLSHHANRTNGQGHQVARHRLQTATA